MGKNNNEQIRLFVAIDLPDYVVQEIVKIQNFLQTKQLFKGKFTLPEQLHMTLKFIGKINKEKMSAIIEALATIKHKAIKATLGEIGVLLSSNYIKIIWLDIVSKEISELANKIEQTLSKFVDPEERNFLSHVTLARVKAVPDKKLLMTTLNDIEVPKVQFMFNEFLLKQSVLLPEGPQHTVIQRFALQ